MRIRFLVAEASVAAINASAQSSAIAASSLQSYIHTLSSRGIQSPADAASAAPVASIQVSRSAPEPTPSEDTVFAEMESAIANNDIDGAFTRALSRQHAKAVNFLIHRFDPVVVTKGNALSQPVILSLLQYLSQADLLDDTATKVAWLQNSMAVSLLLCAVEIAVHSHFQLRRPWNPVMRVSDRMSNESCRPLHRTCKWRSENCMRPVTRPHQLSTLLPSLLDS